MFSSYAHTHKKHGFTLIELSIVLVVIGLIAGGIVLGQHLIEAAEVSKQIGQLRDYTTAYTLFQNKYNYLPGDLPTSVDTQLGFNSHADRCVAYTPACGDGFITDLGRNTACPGGDDCIMSVLYEPLYFFRHLSQSGLINDKVDEISTFYTPDYNYNQFPHLAINPKAAMTVGSYKKQLYFYLIIGLYPAWPGGWSMGYLADNIMTPAQAYSIDKKLMMAIPTLEMYCAVPG